MICAVLIVGASEHSAAAQQNNDNERYTFVLSGISLAAALEQVVDRTSLSLIYETSLVKDKTTWCRAQAVSANELIRCILRNTGVDFVRLSSGTFVLAADRNVTDRTGSITGRVVDASTGLPLANAAVFLADGTIGTYTNERGQFSFLSMPDGPYKIQASHVAFSHVADSLYVESNALQVILLELSPNVVLTEPVIVTGFTQRAQTPPAGIVTADDLESIVGAGVPGDGAASNLGSVAGVLPGDALADVHLQGGAVDEQQLLLDGAPVFIPVANGGIFGPFSAFATGRITIRKAGYGAANGNGLSGVVEIEQTPGLPGGTIQIDPLSVNGRWSLTKQTARGTEIATMIAGRVGMWDVLKPRKIKRIVSEWSAPDAFLRDELIPSDSLEQPSPTQLPLEFDVMDFHLSSRIKISPLQTLRLSGYVGASRFNQNDAAASMASSNTSLSGAGLNSEYALTSVTTSAAYDWVQSSRFFANVMAWRSAYNVTHPTPLSIGQPIDDFNELIEVGARFGGDFSASASHQLRFAADVTHYNSDFLLSTDAFGASAVGPESLRPIRVRLTGFIEDQYAPSKSVLISTGLRTTYVPDRDELFAEPRIAIQLDRTARAVDWSARVSGGLYRQFLTSIDLATHNVSALLPQVRVWVPVGVGQPIPSAYHVAAALTIRPSPAWESGLEVFHKEQRNLSELNFARPDTLASSLLTNATGFGTGFSAFVRHASNWSNTTVSYEFTRARKTISGRFNGRDLPVPWDNPHSIFAASDIRVTNRIAVTARWQLRLGRTWGFRQTYYDYLEPASQPGQFAPFNLSEPEKHQLPAFSQADIGVSYTKKLSGVNLQARLLLVNVANRKNIIDWALDRDANTNGLTKRNRLAVPFFPSLSIRLSI